MTAQTTQSQSTIQSNLVLDPKCGDIPEHWIKNVIPRHMGNLKKVGQFALLTRNGVSFYLFRKSPATFWLTTDAEGAGWQAALGDYSWGPAMWKVLHRAAKLGKLDQGFLDSFTKNVPCGECKRHWKKLLLELPFDPSDPFFWSVLVHNAVNKRLEKPVMLLSEAHQLYAES